MSRLGKWLRSVAEYLLPVPTQSEFSQRGTLTPDEFVQAGDLLVHKCPTWSWESGDSARRKEYLPVEKQYLVLRRVPCLRRAADLTSSTQERENIADVNSDWDVLDVVGWDSGHVHTELDEIPSSSTSSSFSLRNDVKESGSVGCEISVNQNFADEEEDIPDMDDFDETDNILVDPMTTLTVDSNIPPSSSGDSNILRHRTYNMYITYDLFYHTPRAWLYGFDEDDGPLPPERVMEDVYADYANNTVTIDNFPHLALRMAYIHPCRHAEVMKKMVDRFAEGGRFLRVDLYLFVFLKFLSAVLPHISYDNTFEIG